MMLGLDFFGLNTDDIDALCVNDADANNEFDPLVDTVWFSLTPGSLSLTIMGDSAADIFAAPFVAGAPVVRAMQLGLLGGAGSAEPEMEDRRCKEGGCPSGSPLVARHALGRIQFAGQGLFGGLPTGVAVGGWAGRRNRYVPVER